MAFDELVFWRTPNGLVWTTTRHHIPGRSALALYLVSGTSTIDLKLSRQKAEELVPLWYKTDTSVEEVREARHFYLGDDRPQLEDATNKDIRRIMMILGGKQIAKLW